VQLDQWLNTALEAMSEVVTAALDLPHYEVRALGEPLPEGLFGAYVPLSMRTSLLYVGVLAELQTCRFVGRALLGILPHEEPECESHVFDAVGEVANLLAGGIKQRNCTGDIQLGLPSRVQGSSYPPLGVSSASARVTLAGKDAWVVLNSPGRATSL
jgi:hypothetical protein